MKSEQVGRGKLNQILTFSTVLIYSIAFKDLTCSKTEFLKLLNTFKIIYSNKRKWDIYIYYMASSD